MRTLTVCTFKEMDEKHLQKELEIYNYYVENSTATFHKHLVSQEELRDILFFDNYRYKSFAILFEDEVCGYCILSRYSKREAYDITAEATLYLHPGFCGKGIGGLALEYLEEIASKNNFHSLIAIICSENMSSIKLFEKKGYSKCAFYEEVGEKFGRLLDIVCYQKKI